MGCLGVHFAVTDIDAQRLLRASSDDEVLVVLRELEERWEKDHLAESDKAWDAIHRCLGDGSLDCDDNENILEKVVLGGQRIFSGEDYIVSFVSSDEVRDIAKALLPITEDAMRERYLAIDPEDYDGELGEDDFHYTWDWFENVRELYLRASIHGRAVVFTADQ
jgi:Domain of unknown function (DUF1877)